MKLILSKFPEILSFKILYCLDFRFSRFGTDEIFTAGSNLHIYFLDISTILRFNCYCADESANK